MDTSTQERAIKGLIDFWEDIYFVQGKRLALDILGITVYLDGDSLEMTGVISPEDSGTVFTSSQ